MSITNTTLPGHPFYYGTVQSSIVDNLDGIYVQPGGIGTNSNCGNKIENYVAGELGFDGPDSNIRAYITDPGFYDPSLRGPGN